METVAKKILLLSDLNSVHTQRWAASIAEKGFVVKVVGLNPLETPSSYYQNKNISITSLILHGGSRINYFLGIPKLKKIIEEFHPDIVHAHYATSYGLLANLTKKTKLFLTMWGDDVLIFPKKSRIHKKLLQFNLSKADHLSAASHVLERASKLYSPKDVSIIAFGVNTELFTPVSVKNKDKLVVGTIKALEDIYGIDYLIQAFKIVKEKFQGSIELLIVGKGSREDDLKRLVQEMGLTGSVTFTGKVDHTLVPEYHKKIDIFVALSRSESFGVAIVEAQSCAVPAVVSDVGGLPEVVENNVTGLIVPVGDIGAAANAILSLARNWELRFKMGQEGRRRACQLFNWNNNVNAMIDEYNKVLR